MTEQPSISIIVPVGPPFETLETCLHSIAAQSIAMDTMELVAVINGGELDLKPLITRFPKVRFLSNAESGSYAARNRGIVETTGKYLGFIDADCIADADWIRNGIAALEEMRTDIIVGKVDMTTGSPPSISECYDLAVTLKSDQILLERGYAITANLFTRRDVFLATGMFDPSVFSGGDRLWSQKAIKCGFKIGYAEKVVVAHPARKSLDDLTNRVGRIVVGVLDRVKPPADSESTGFNLAEIFLFAKINLLNAFRILHRNDLSLRNRLKALLAWSCVQCICVWALGKRMLAVFTARKRGG